MIRLLPGLALCVAIAVVARVLEAGELGMLGRAWVDGLVLAILLGALVRTAWKPSGDMPEGIAFAAKPVLEVAIVLLGLTLDVPLLLQAGPLLIAAIVIAVGAALVGAYAIGRLLGLSPQLSALVAVGNAICGNSAIAAAAPVLRAEARDVAAAISFTAVMGVAVVLVLPLSGAVLGLDDYQYGVVAGLTVYAVPQVLAATLPVSELSGDVGTVVKLTRVLLLGPVLVGLGIWVRSALNARSPVAASQHRPSVMPWFIAGFLLMALARGTGIVPDAAVGPAREISKVLTIIALAALGLGVDFRAIRHIGARVAVAAAGGLTLLALVAVVLVRTIV